MAIATLLVIGGGAAAYAWTTVSTNPGTGVTGATLGPAAGLGTTKTPPTGDACTAVTVAWTAATNADRYRVEARTANAASWTTLATSHATTSISDATGYTHRTVTWRITPLVAGTSWEGPSATVTATCGVGEVSNLAATNPCSSSAITWSAATNATNYDVWRTVNGGAATLVAADQAGTSYSDTTVHASAATVDYWLVPGNGATNGWASNTSTIVGWDSFRVLSVAVADSSGTPGSLNAGDTITMAFSKQVDRTSMTGTSITTARNGNPRGLFLPSSSATVAGAEVAHVDAATNFYGTTGTWPGTVAWNAADTTWTWTSSGAGSTMTGALSGTWALGTSGTRAECAADGTTVLQAAPAPTMSGRW